MGIQLKDNINLFEPKSLDARYGPWTSTTEANSGIISANRYIGLTVGVLTGDTSFAGGRYETATGGTIEYWYFSGVTDSDLVIKEGGAGGDSGSSGSSGTSGSS